MTNIPHFDVKKSIIKKFFLAHQEKFGKYDLQNGFGKYYLSSNLNSSFTLLSSSKLKNLGLNRTSLP